MAQNDLVQQLRDLDQVLTSRDPTVIDAFKQAIVLTKVAEDSMNINPVGPLEQMWRGLQDMRRELDQLKADAVNKDRGTYWSKDTYERGRNYGNWGLNTTPYMPTATLTPEQIAELTDIMYRNPVTTSTTSGTVMPASPTDLDAFTMFDPDTGDSMSVKYK
jgi:hypothetical protein